ncbi:MAG TPA: hypothetical protein VGP82_25090 [Ktedonobacterales bacterium]|nr:hypothetical protein [Ktedonobacterales bacterium]
MAGAPLSVLLDRHLQQRRCLLILDTMDHLRAVGTELQELLRLHDQRSILVPSRTRLGLPEEHLYEVRPLAVPTVRRPPLETLLEYPAIALLVERVQELVPDFALTPRGAQAILAICTSVNGTPPGVRNRGGTGSTCAARRHQSSARGHGRCGYPTIPHA